jgi:pimeloyl-ACP methyl ester carboxylesterase
VLACFLVNAVRPLFKPFFWCRRFNLISSFEEKTIDVEGKRTRYLTAGSGPPLVLLHGVGTSAGEWSWVIPALARNHLVYAIDLPGYDGSDEPPNSAYSSAFSARFISSFLDAVGVESAVVVGNSFGGLIALHLALSEPARVSALVLSDSAGLGRAVSPALVALTLPGLGELTVALGKTPLGAAHRAFRRSLVMFARPWQIPFKWLTGQYKVAQLPGFTEAAEASLRSAVGLIGQREMLVDQLPRLEMPTLVVWGIEDKVLPYWQAMNAVIFLKKGDLKLIPSCGHLPHVEQPERFVESLGRFLSEHSLLENRQTLPVRAQKQKRLSLAV